MTALRQRSAQYLYKRYSESEDSDGARSGYQQTARSRYYFPYPIPERHFRRLLLQGDDKLRPESSPPMEASPDNRSDSRHRVHDTSKDLPNGSAARLKFRPNKLSDEARPEEW